MRKVLAVLSVLVLGTNLVACAPGEPEVKPTAQPQPRQTATLPELAQYYQQKLSWSSCGGAFECAKLTVPLDYKNPDDGQAQIALKRLATPSETKLGTLVMNPGGPGGSGLENMTDSSVTYFFTPQVRQNYDVLSFDPRGVGQSTPAAKCRGPQQLDRDNADFFDITTAQGRTKYLETNQRLGAECLANSPEMIRFASTDYTARDLDILRQALGEERLNYLGYSYGTYLGAIYADLFPQRVGRLVLDGVLDASMNINQVAAAQAVGFEKALAQFSTECQEYHAANCPLHGGPAAGLEQIRTFLDSLIESPLPTQDKNRPLTTSLAFTGIIGSLYNQISWWQTLMPALNAAINQGDGSALLKSADYYNSREDDGSYSDNSADAFVLINSLDYAPVGTPEQWEQAAQQVLKDAPTVGRFFIYPSLGADKWPVPGDPQAKRVVNPKLDSNILLIATTGDPATPYQMAEKTRTNMTHSRLLTVKGWNHTAYNASSASCVRNITDKYLITGEIVADATGGVCSIK